MSSGRAQLDAALRAALPTWQIVSTQRGLDSIRKPGAVVLWTAKRKRAPTLGLGWYEDEVVVWVLSAADKPELIEDDLDELSLELFAALEPLGSFTWEEATKGVLAETFDGYRIPVTCFVKITPTP